MSDQHQPHTHRQAGELGRAMIGLAGVGACVGGGMGGFANLRLLAQDFSVSADGTRDFLTPMAIYHSVWLLFFLALLVTGISLIIAAIRGRSEDIVPGPSIYIMGTTMVIAGMFQLLFGNMELAAVTGLVGVVLMVVEYRSALL